MPELMVTSKHQKGEKYDLTEWLLCVGGRQTGLNVTETADLLSGFLHRMVQKNNNWKVTVKVQEEELVWADKKSTVSMESWKPCQISQNIERWRAKTAGDHISEHRSISGF